MFLDKPIFGHGPKMFRVICKKNKYATGVRPCDTHPHNFYIQLLAETGIIGFSFLFIALVYVIYCALKKALVIVCSVILILYLFSTWQHESALRLFLLLSQIFGQYFVFVESKRVERVDVVQELLHFFIILPVCFIFVFFI